MSTDFVYNLSCKVTWSIADDWLRWQQSEHLPEILATGRFDGYRIYKLEDQENEEGPTFIIQLYSKSKKAYQEYIKLFAYSIGQKAFERWGDQFIAHRTTMSLVH